MDVQAFLEELPFVELLGIEITEVGDGHATAVLEMREELSWSSGKLLAHGGVTFTLAETAGAAALLADNEPPVFTIDARIDYITGSQGNLSARADVVRDGTTTGITDVAVTDERGETVVSATAVYKL